MEFLLNICRWISEGIAFFCDCVDAIVSEDWNGGDDEDL